MIGSKQQADSSGAAVVGRSGLASSEALLACGVIAAATVLAYSNTFDASFHFDDVASIVHNERLRDLADQWPPSGSRWVGYVTLALNHRFGGLEVFGYHVVNLLIHVCNALLVFWVTALTLRTPALQHARTGPLVRTYLPVTAGLLFALHPTATQAVTYVVQRFASLATLFFLLSVALYAEARLSLEQKRPSVVRAAWLHAAALLAAAAAMRTKEIAFTLPLVVAAYERLLFARRRRPLLLVPVFAIAALLFPFGVTTAGRPLGEVLGEASRLAAETPDIPRTVYLLTQTRVVVTYIRLLVLPIGQNLDHDFPVSRSIADPDVVVAIAILAAVAAASVVLLRRARRANRAAGVLVFFGVVWFFVTVSIESSVIPIRDVIFEHRVYLPSAGAVIALGTALLTAVEALNLRAAHVLQVVLALSTTAGPLGVATYARNLVWKDELTLWSDVVAKSPEKARARANLANAYLARGRVDDAVREAREAVRLAPGQAMAHHVLAQAHQAAGRGEDAAREYRESSRLDSATAHDDLAAAGLSTERLEEGVREALEAVRLHPEQALAHHNLGVAYQARGDLDAAMRSYREAIRLAPGLADAHNNLGVVHHARGELEHAERAFREASRIEPRAAEALSNLGGILAEQGRAAEAVDVYRRALGFSHMPEIVFNLAGALEADGRVTEAVVEYERFLAERGDRYADRAQIAQARIARLRATRGPSFR